jgi:hypothetical protein
MIKKIFLLSIFFSINIVYNSCTYKKQTLCTADNTTTYTNTVKVILEDNCTGCHGGANPSANIKLDSYNDLLAYAKDNPKFLSSINHDGAALKMPYPMGSAKMPDSTVAQVKKWVDACLPE